MNRRAKGDSDRVSASSTTSRASAELASRQREWISAAAAWASSAACDVQSREQDQDGHAACLTPAGKLRLTSN